MFATVHEDGTTTYRVFPSYADHVMIATGMLRGLLNNIGWTEDTP